MLTEREPLDAVRVRTLVQDIIVNGIVAYTKHIRERAVEKSFTLEDVLNTLRGGVCIDAIIENGTWRYQVGTPTMVVVVAFRSESELVTITAWRR